MKTLRYIVLLCLLALTGFSQESADTSAFVPEYPRGINHTVKTTQGDVYSGFVKEETKEFVTLENRITHQTVELRKSSIIRKSAPERRDLRHELLGENVHASDYLFLNSAFLFEEGKVSTNSHWLLFEHIEYAVNDHWAVTLNTLAFYPLTLGLKCAYKLSGDNYLGGAAFGIGDVLSGTGGTPLWGYGIQGKFTKGNSNRNVTLSAGMLGLNADLFYTSTNKPFVNVNFVSGAFCTRFSKKVALNLEGWYFPDVAIGLGGLGFKFIGDDVTCWTIGCYTLMNSYDQTVKINLKTIPIPYFGVSRRFD